MIVNSPSDSMISIVSLQPIPEARFPVIQCRHFETSCKIDVGFGTTQVGFALIPNIAANSCVPTQWQPNPLKRESQENEEMEKYANMIKEYLEPLREVRAVVRVIKTLLHNRALYGSRGGGLSGTSLLMMVLNVVQNQPVAKALLGRAVEPANLNDETDQANESEAREDDAQAGLLLCFLQYYGSKPGFEYQDKFLKVTTAGGQIRVQEQDRSSMPHGDGWGREREYTLAIQVRIHTRPHSLKWRIQHFLRAATNVPPTQDPQAAGRNMSSRCQVEDIVNVFHHVRDRTLNAKFETANYPEPPAWEISTEYHRLATRWRDHFVLTHMTRQPYMPAMVLLRRPT